MWGPEGKNKLAPGQKGISILEGTDPTVQLWGAPKKIKE